MCFRSAIKLKISVDSIEDVFDSVVIFGRESDGTLQQISVTNIPCYCYISVSDFENNHLEFEPRIVSYEKVPFKAIRGEPVYKCYLLNQFAAKDLRDSFRLWEGDIRAPTRLVVDKNIREGIECPGPLCDFNDISPCSIKSPYRVCTFDIECENHRGFPSPDRDAITSITLHDSFTDKYTVIYLDNYNVKDNMVDTLNHNIDGIDTLQYIKSSNERELLINLVDYFNTVNPDMLTGWFIKGFDVPYIQKRMMVLNLNPDNLARIDAGWKGKNMDRIPGRAVFDLRDAYEKLQANKKPSYRLDAIAQEELGTQKISYTGNLTELWKNDLPKFLEYNIVDVSLCVGIERKNTIVDFYREIARYVGTPVESTMNNSWTVDTLILRASKDNFALPSRGDSDIASDSFKGAVVLEPSTGLKENVVVLDLTSLYPMIMTGLNISYETKVLPNQDIDPRICSTTPVGVRFRQDITGMTKNLLLNLYEERKEKKRLRDQEEYGSHMYKQYDLQQRVLKEIMNSYYGVSGFSFFRLYDKDLGAATTSVGRAVIQFSKEETERLGYEVIYGDTDSIIVALPPELSREETISLAIELHEHLNSKYDDFAYETFNISEHFFDIKFEKIYERFFQGGKKKRYAGLLVWKEGVETKKIDITGFETKRSDTAKICRIAQEKLLEMIVMGNTKGEIKTYLSDIMRKYYKHEYPISDIAVPGGISKSLSKYARPDAHIRGAIYSNRSLGTYFKAGDKPKRIYIKRMPKGYPQTDVLCFESEDQIPKGCVIDIDKMILKAFTGPIKRITDVLGLNWYEVNPTTTTLESFFQIEDNSDGLIAEEIYD